MGGDELEPQSLRCQLLPFLHNHHAIFPDLCYFSFSTGTPDNQVQVICREVLQTSTCSYTETERKWRGGRAAGRLMDKRDHFSSLALKPAAPRLSTMKATCRLPSWLSAGSCQSVYSSVHWFPGSSSDESSQMLLSCRSGSMSSSVPLPGGLARLPLMLLCF